MPHQHAQDHRCTCTALAAILCSTHLLTAPWEICTPLFSQAGAKYDFKGFVRILFDVTKASQAGNCSAFPLGSCSASLNPSGRRVRPQILGELTTAARSAARQPMELREQQIQPWMQLPILSPPPQLQSLPSPPSTHPTPSRCGTAGPASLPGCLCSAPAPPSSKAVQRKSWQRASLHSTFSEPGLCTYFSSQG